MALTPEQADRLVNLASVIPMTCAGAGHEDGSDYCNAFDGDLTDLMGDPVSVLLGETSYASDYRICDQVAAYLYGQSQPLRDACWHAEAVRSGDVRDGLEGKLRTALELAALEVLS